MELEIPKPEGAVWQAEDAKVYRCQTCGRPVFTPLIGRWPDPSEIRCGVDAHVLVWPDASPVEAWAHA